MHIPRLRWAMWKAWNAWDEVIDASCKAEIGLRICVSVIVMSILLSVSLTRECHTTKERDLGSLCERASFRILLSQNPSQPREENNVWIDRQMETAGRWFTFLLCKNIQDVC